MKISKTGFLAVGVPWLITILVALAFIFYSRRDTIDDFVLLALLLLSGNRTFTYFRNKKKERTGQ